MRLASVHREARAAAFRRICDLGVRSVVREERPNLLWQPDRECIRKSLSRLWPIRTAIVGHFANGPSLMASLASLIAWLEPKNQFSFCPG